MDDTSVYKWWGIGISVFLMTIVACWALLPIWKHVDTETTRQSEQYRASKETMLVDSMNEWTKLQVKANDFASEPQIVQDIHAQQNALLVRMHTESQRVGMSHVPPDVRTFLEQHPRP